LRKTN